ncbi:MAG TPA: phosphotransferase [Streptosporangiaceae bacterium]|nr:phosphotransferase [Streptosporangiaceae bacterium]
MRAADLAATPATDGPLYGGTANRGLVIRVGQTVRRPAAPFRAATHALLAHLAAVGFDGAPRVLATSATTDTLTYIDGRAATLPLPDETLTDAALVSVAELLRRYHRAVASFDPGGYRWPHVPARFTTQLVSHNDVYPANFIFRGGRAVALIDFDLAGPGGAAWDLAAAARYWCPLRDERDVSDARQGRALTRFRLLLEAYGLTAVQRREVAEAIPHNHDWDCAIIAEGVRTGHPGFTDAWKQNGGAMRRARRWYEAHHHDLIAAAT